jgi:hypothetical protein
MLFWEEQVINRHPHKSECWHVKLVGAMDIPRGILLEGKRKKKTCFAQTSLLQILKTNVPLSHFQANI